MIELLNSSLKRIAVLNNVTQCTTEETINSEYTMALVCTMARLKSDLLFNKDNVLLVDDEYYKLFSIKELHKSGESVTLECKAEHIGYEIIQEIFEEGFKYSGPVSEIANHALRYTRFSCITTCTDNIDIEIEGITNARQVIDKICQKCNLFVRWHKFEIHLLSLEDGGNVIRVQFDGNTSYVTRETNLENEKVTYEIELNDQHDATMHDLKRVHLGDRLKIYDSVLNIAGIEKQVIAVHDDKLLKLAKEVQDYTIEQFDRSLSTSTTTTLIVGDRQSTLEEELTKIITDKVPKQDTLIEVINQEIVNANTAMITSCWIDELSVEYLETNFSALDRRKPYQSTRHFFRIFEEHMQCITQTLSDTETEDYKTPSGRQVYWTAIGEANQAYQYFTTTDPLLLNPDVTNPEDFKVKVRKVLSEQIKMETAFKEVTCLSGLKTVMPLMTWGAGIDPTGITDRGKGYIYKDPKGLVLKYMHTQNDEFSGILLDDDGVKFWNRINKDFTSIGSTSPTINLDKFEGTVVIHKDKAAFTEDMLTGSNAIHVGYDSAQMLAAGENSTAFASNGILAIESVSKQVEITPIGKYLFIDGDECTTYTGGWAYGYHGNGPLGESKNTGEYMYFYQKYGSSPYACNSSAYTQNTVDFTNVSKIVVNFSYESVGLGHVLCVALRTSKSNTYVHSNGIYSTESTLGYDGSATVYTGEMSVEIDVSAITGAKYMQIGSFCSPYSGRWTKTYVKSIYII